MKWRIVKRIKMNNTIMIGLLFLVIANLSRWFFQHHGITSENIADGVLGMFYGLAIGCMILGVRRGCRTMA
jgi:hypothetical protein